LIHGLNRHYYSASDLSVPGLREAGISSTDWTGLAIDYRKTEAEQGMLLNLHKRGWTEGLKLRDFEEQEKSNEAALTVSRRRGFLFPKQAPRIKSPKQAAVWRKHVATRVL
jgi:hypothetical protein